MSSLPFQGTLPWYLPLQGIRDEGLDVNQLVEREELYDDGLRAEVVQSHNIFSPLNQKL